MKKKESEDQTIDECILRTVRVKKPENVAELVTLVQQGFHYSDKEILNHTLTLLNEDKIVFEKEPVAAKTIVRLSHSEPVYVV